MDKGELVEAAGTGDDEVAAANTSEGSEVTDPKDNEGDELDTAEFTA